MKLVLEYYEKLVRGVTLKIKRYGFIWMGGLDRLGAKRNN